MASLPYLFSLNAMVTCFNHSFVVHHWLSWPILAFSTHLSKLELCLNLCLYLSVHAGEDLPDRSHFSLYPWTSGVFWGCLVIPLCGPRTLPPLNLLPLLPHHSQTMIFFLYLWENFSNQKRTSIDPNQLFFLCISVCTLTLLFFHLLL